MPRIGSGPVFHFECLTSSRRWQFYAVRVLFVGALLSAFLIVWYGQLHRRLLSIGRDAEAGEKFYYAVVSTELALLLLVAPAATAGAICVDKSRGTLSHVLVTDLSDAEIVFGKLWARLLPVLSLIACTAPVMFLGSLLGGIDPQALAGSLLVLSGTVLLSASIAFTISIWARKTHEVLLATYGILAIWLVSDSLLGQLDDLAARLFDRDLTLTLESANPFYLLYRAYRSPGALLWFDYGSFFLFCFVASALLACISVWFMRRVAVRQMSQPAVHVRNRRWLCHFLRPGIGLPGPSLDLNPILWREWHRNRPSRFVRTTWLGYTLVATTMTLVTIFQKDATVAAWVNALQFSIGLLLISINAATSLADERARGTLDVLLATPLSTRTIVLGKFWGGFRAVPLLALLPVIVLVPGAIHNFRPMAIVLAIWQAIAFGAAITSFGLLMATWVKRMNVSVILTVGGYGLVTVGWMILVLVFVNGMRSEGVASASPFMSMGSLTFDLWTNSYQAIYGWIFFWCSVFSTASLVFVVLICLTFDWCMGRVPDRGSRVDWHVPMIRISSAAPSTSSVS